MLRSWVGPDVGSLETGKFADVVAVPGNPLEDITALERPFRDEGRRNFPNDVQR